MKDLFKLVNGIWNVLLGIILGILAVWGALTTYTLVELEKKYPGGLNKLEYDIKYKKFDEKKESSN